MDLTHCELRTVHAQHTDRRRVVVVGYHGTLHCTRCGMCVHARIQGEANGKGSASIVASLRLRPPGRLASSTSWTVAISRASCSGLTGRANLALMLRSGRGGHHHRHDEALLVSPDQTRHMYVLVACTCQWTHAYSRNHVLRRRMHDYRDGDVLL
jgi:hypothetical protein